MTDEPKDRPPIFGNVFMHLSRAKPKGVFLQGSITTGPIVIDMRTSPTEEGLLYFAYPLRAGY